MGRAVIAYRWRDAVVGCRAGNGGVDLCGVAHLRWAVELAAQPCAALCCGGRGVGVRTRVWFAAVIAQAPSECIVALFRTVVFAFCMAARFHSPRQGWIFGCSMASGEQRHHSACGAAGVVHQVVLEYTVWPTFMVNASGVGGEIGLRALVRMHL